MIWGEDLGDDSIVVVIVTTAGADNIQMVFVLVDMLILGVRNRGKLMMVNIVAHCKRLHHVYIDGDIGGDAVADSFRGLMSAAVAMPYSAHLSDPVAALVVVGAVAFQTIGVCIQLRMTATFQ